MTRDAFAAYVATRDPDDLRRLAETLDGCRRGEGVTK
jgi:hypothetical protein